MIRSIKYDSIRKIIVLCCNFLPFSSFLLKHILNNANVVNVLCFYKKKKKKKKKRSRENTIIGRNYDLECNVTQHRDLAAFLFCALFPCALFVLRTFCPRPNVVDRCSMVSKMAERYCSQILNLRRYEFDYDI